MANKKVIFLLIFSLLLTSCSMLVTEMRKGYWEQVLESREPGQNLLKSKEYIWNKYNCAQISLPYIKIEANELLPKYINAGQEINHHLEYSMCTGAEVVKGNIFRRIYYKNQKIFEDITNGVRFKPGKWSIDAFIFVPEEANSGLYSYETIIQFEKRTDYWDITSFCLEGKASGQK